MKKLWIALAVVVGILAIQWNTYALELPTGKRDELVLNITYESNLVLARHNVEVYVDGELLTTLAQGDHMQRTLNLAPGRHEILFTGGGKTALDLVDVSVYTYYTCVLKAHIRSIEICDLTTNGFVNEMERKKHTIEKNSHLWVEADYERYARFPDEFKGKQLLVKGKIVAVCENAWGMMKLVVQDKNNQLWIVEYIRGKEAPRILTNDSVEVYGYGRGITTYKSSVETYPLLPTVRLDYAEIQNFEIAVQ